MNPSPRLFVAVPLPTELKSHLAQWVQGKRREWSFSKWVDTADYHITLHFLGSCTPEQVDAIIPALANVAQTQKSFSLQMKGVGTFGRSSEPRILWTGVTGEINTLTQLQKRITDALTPIGFPAEDRPYRAHITVARKYRDNHFPVQQLQTEKEWEGGSWRVDHIVLYETKMGQTPMYHVQERFEFGS